MNKIEDQISLLRQEIEDYPLDDSNLQLYKKKFLNKEGKIQQLFHALPTLASNERKTVGIKLNQLKNLVQNRYEKIKVTVQDKTQKEEKDITLPPPTIGVGTLHILTQVRERIVAILKKIGFNVVEGPEIEDEWHNFSALNFPDHHPARDMQDTFFVTNPQGEKMYLRTQTSCVQIRVMEEKKLPIRILSIGRVFRKETISSRSHCVFHQVEGLYINTNVSFIDLKEVLIYFVQELFGKDIKMRLRPSFFPFTEPSAEIDIVCLLCKGAKCTVCKKSGWVEIGGTGMVHPNVLHNCGISPEDYSGFAFGIGIERMAMLLSQIPDIRLFTENDLRFLQQFTSNNFC